MKSGATESSFHYLAQHYQFPKNVDVKRTTNEIITSTNQYKVIWAHDNCDQMGHKDLPQYVDKIDGIVCVSNWEAEQFVKFKRAPAEKLYVIPNGIHEMFKLSGKPKSKTCIFFSAPHKGVKPLVPIWKEVIKHHPDAKLKVFSSMSLYGDIQPGEGDDETITGPNGLEPSPFVPVYKELKQLPGVEYSPCIDREELLEHIQDAAFYIHPNVWEETFCVSLAEAMACGCFPITTDMGALPETSNGMGKYIPMSGQNTSRGWITDDTFHKNFAEEVIRALHFFGVARDEYDQVSQMISKFSTETYNWKTVSNKWKEYIKKITNNKDQRHILVEINKGNYSFDIVFMSENYKEIALAKADDVLDDSNEFMFKVLSECDKWKQSERELAQGRSNFQIEKFIVHDNFTIPSAFKSAIINRKSVAENLLNSIQDAKRIVREFHFKWDGKDKTQPIWWKTRQGGEELCWYDIDEFNFHRFIDGLNAGFQAQVGELEFFDKLIARLIELNGGHPPTKEEFDADQPVYWERRFANQALDELLAARSGVSGGNIRSMRRATAPTVLEDDVNRIKEGYADPSNPIAFLESLQKHVSSGIEEISGITSRVLEGNAQNQNQLPDDVSLFNDKLRK